MVMNVTMLARFPRCWCAAGRGRQYYDFVAAQKSSVGEGRRRVRPSCRSACESGLADGVPRGVPVADPPTDGRPRFATSADLARVAGRSLLLLALPWQYFAACIRTSSNSSPRTRSSRSRPWSSLSSDGTYRRPVGPSTMPRIRPIRRTYVQARSAAAAEEGAGVTAGFDAAVRGGSAVTTRATPKIASPPPMSTTPVTGSDKITAPNNTATAGLT